MTSTRRVGFKLHNNLISHLVDRQAATPEKALLELVMNAADAGATRVDLSLTAKGFVLCDNGRGFQSEDEIEQFFATFGTPQEQEKTYGRYRVGRAQIFGWASTAWESNSYRMAVDLAQDEHGFDLSALDPPVPGCRITGTWNLRGGRYYGNDPEHLQRELAGALSFPPLEVSINGSLVAKPADEQEWTSQTKDAYFRLATHGPLRVYNQGIFVCAYEHTRFHVGGAVVSKQAIELTMSRNEPLPYGMLWQRIERHLHEQAKTLHGTGASVGTEEFRVFALRQALRHKGSFDAEMITLVPKQHVALEQFIARLLQTRCLVYAERGTVSQVENGLRAMKTPATVLHFETLERVRAALDIPHDVEDGDVVTLLLDRLDAVLAKLGRGLPQLQILGPSDLPQPDLDTDRLPLEAISRTEQRFLAGFQDTVAQPLYDKLDIHPRAIVLAKPNKNIPAFTDGYAFVAFSQSLIKDVIRNRKGSATELVLTFIHELCHQSDSRNAGHDDVFYQRYHSLTVDQSAAIEAAIAATTQLIYRVTWHSPIATRPLETRLLWWDADPPPTSNTDICDDIRDATRKAFALLGDGKIKPEGAKQQIEAAVRAIHTLGAHLSIDQVLERVAPRLRLIGPARTLYFSQAFDRRPDRALLEGLTDPAFDAVQFEATYLSENTHSAPVFWHGHQVGSLLIQKSGIVWRPSTKQNAGKAFAAMFETLAMAQPEAFPWTKRRFERDLAWAMVVRLTFSLWRRAGCWHNETPADYQLVRRRSDAIGSFLRVQPLEQGKRPSSLDRWRDQLRAKHPELILLTPQQLMDESRAAFAKDAAAAKTSDQVSDFWFKWMYEK